MDEVSWCLETGFGNQAEKARPDEKDYLQNPYTLADVEKEDDD